jgi:hypothetical protein
MKRKIIILLTILLCAICTISLGACKGGCNYTIIDLQYAYNYAYMKIGDTWVNVPISQWNDYEDGEQIQVTLEDGSKILTSSINCILYYGELPKT